MMARAERPLDAGDSPLLRLASDLRKLREKAGSPAYRELSRRAHYSIGALSDAAAGRRLPSLAVTLAYVDACGGDTAAWEQRWHKVAAELRATATAEDGPDTDEEQVPYVGLTAFGPEDANRFFGRERLVADLCTRVANRRFVVVVGPSGSGKSSLLRAGLLHHVRTHGLHGIPGGPTVVMTPGPHPLQECAAQLAVLVSGSASALHTALRADTGCLHLTALQALVDHATQLELLVVIDQFEEVFSLCRDPDERLQFLSVLRTSAQARNSRTRIVLGVRADFYAHCAQYPDLVEGLRDSQILVGPMTTEELRLAITQPAIYTGWRVETALVSRVIADATGQPGVLPLVSHALLETWRRRRGNTLTLTGYEAAGGIAQAIARTAEAVHTALSPDQQQWARQLFHRLVALGEGTEDTKRRLHRMELDFGHPDVSTVLDRLAQARLVTLDYDSIEITHEALIRCWPRLRDWFSEDREGLRVHRQLTNATQVWESLGRDPGALFRGTRLDLARDFAETRGAALTSRERAFLNVSLAAEAAEHAVARRRTQRLHYLVTLLAVLLILATAATIYAVHAENAITQQRNIALSQKVASDAVALRLTNPALAAQLSLATCRLAPTTDARNGLLSTLTRPLVGHTEGVSSAVFSPDGRTLATGSYDRTVRLWDISNPQHPAELATLTGHTDTVFSVAFSPDGHTLATASRDRTVRLWNISNPQRPAELATLTGHTDTVFSVAFSPDGHTLASGTYDHTIRLWNITDPAHPKDLSTLTGHTLNVKPVAFSPDGRTLASGSDDRTVRLWNITDIQHPTELATLTGHTDFVDTVAFSPDGRTLASGSDDHTVRLWNITNLQHPTQAATLTGHADIVTSVAFSPDGRTLAAGSNDRTARFWNITDIHRPEEVATLTGHTGAINAVVFSPNGRTFATASDDHTAQLGGTDAHLIEALACDTAHPTITRSEWEQYFLDLDYQPPCPQ
jgi:WD40 repeat protein/energy-coupling factor transporter ATP-binding protein EcfA2